MNPADLFRRPKEDEIRIRAVPCKTEPLALLDDDLFFFVAVYTTVWEEEKIGCLVGR